MMRVVIDTNCLLAAIPPSRPEFWLYQAFRAEAFEWVVSNEILAEYEEQLTEFYNAKTADRVLKILLGAPNVLLSEPFYRWNLIQKDPDDNKFADLAISTNARFLVSEDRHFAVLKKVDFPTVEVVKLARFKAILDY